MPQLSPLNWIFLFILFWTAVIITSILIWWTKKTLFMPLKTKKTIMKQNKWNW